MAEATHLNTETALKLLHYIGQRDPNAPGKVDDIIELYRKCLGATYDPISPSKT